MNKSDIDHYWYAFLASLPADSKYFGKTYVVERFGDDLKLADELGQLAASGKKNSHLLRFMGVGGGEEAHSPTWLDIHCAGWKRPAHLYY